MKPLWKRQKTAIKQQFPQVKLITMIADVSDEAAVKAYVEMTLKTFGRIEGLARTALMLTANPSPLMEANPIVTAIYKHTNPCYLSPNKYRTSEKIRK
ncbi:hypothetical protein [Dyadobacter frigoris]|uniref:hypothetical protein n=1 Tax=Dyadobacter frigoris TaxID=2576211 RepID=UPI0025530EDC|nr:hypothetical protein [Dyadobacter frigoris]